jgi:tetratricopeptide (TPR) repeat protein
MAIFLKNINKKGLSELNKLAIFFKQFGKVRASNILSYYVLNNFKKAPFKEKKENINNDEDINIIEICKSIMEKMLKKENLPKNESILLDIIKEFLNMYKDYDYLSIDDISEEIININIEEDLISNQLNIYEKHLGKLHPDTILLYEEMSYIKYKQKNYVESEKYILKVINYFMNSNDDINDKKTVTIAALENLANILFKQEKYDKAKKIYETVIKCFESNKNIDKKTLSYCYENLAKLYEKLGEFHQSEYYYKKVLNIIIENFCSDGFSEESIYIAYFNIASSLEYQFKYTEAASNYEEALEGFERLYDENDIRIFECYNYLADIYYKLNRCKESLTYLKKSLIACSEIYGLENESCNLILQRINLCSEKINSWKRREQFFSSNI